jgi:hypothetical protein
MRKECHRVGFGAERRQCLSEKEKLVRFTLIGSVRGEPLVQVGAELSERILDAGGP